MPLRWNTLKAAVRIKPYTFSRPIVTLSATKPLEEETLPHYEVSEFYPVHIGDVYDGRYRIAGKLGYGTYSTSWLCQNLQDKKYFVLKVSTSLAKHPSATDREFKIYEHLANIDTLHPGQSLIREVYDSFDLQHHSGRHQCLVLQPMLMTLLDMIELGPEPLDLPLLKGTLKRLLLALDFQHTEAEVTHLDLKTDNLMLSLEDNQLPADFEAEECNNPSPRKVLGEKHSIYQSRRFGRPRGGRYGLPVLCDFGEARIGKTHETGPFVQPHIYRAPEIIFEMTWGSAVDIWNVGALIWDLFEGKHLFKNIFDDDGRHDAFKHLALMIALIGPPPPTFVERSETITQCFDATGAWIAHQEATVPHITLEILEERLTGSDKESFLRFLRSMLRWLPEERKTAKQLLDDPWLV